MTEHPSEQTSPLPPIGLRSGASNELPPSSAIERLRLGLSFLARNDPVNAHAAFRLALNEAPDNAQIQSCLARSSFLLGAPMLAQHHAQMALAREPKSLDAMITLAGAARRAGDISLSRHVTELLASFPAAAHIHRLLTLALALEDEEFEATLFELAMLLEANPDDKMALELFTAGFDAFQSLGNSARFTAFLDSLGLYQPSDAPALPASPWNFPEPGSIDIIISVKNALSDVQACLGSIRQWWSSAIGKIIFVNDCSDLPTTSWLQKMAETNKNVVVVRAEENLGFTKAIMAGIAQSFTPFTLFLDSDTLVTPGWLDGLWRAMNRRWTTALAGPLSNNAHFQMIGSDRNSKGITGAGSNPVALDPLHAAALVLVSSRKRCPRVPLLSGSCLLVRRDAFDLAGGFDTDAFPKGYGEVQDLCFQLLDFGMDAVLADDVFVHHVGGARISNALRHQLHNEGLAQIHKRHSALRLLVAERLSASEPEIAHHRKARTKHADTLRNGKAPSSAANWHDARTRLECRLLKSSTEELAGREVCVFVVHAPLGSASEYTFGYLRALKAMGLHVIVCLVTDALDIPIDQTFFKYADSVLLRRNGGCDFATWADMISVFPNAWQAERLHFVNDSLIGPFAPLDGIFASIRQQNAGFFALSECTNTDYHAQGFFFGWNQANLKSPILQDFWRDIGIENDKTELGLKYEYAISRLSPDLPDPSQDVVFGMERIFGCDPARISCINPAHHSWRRLLEVGFPFVKTDLLRDGVGAISTEGWQDYCAAKGADVAQMLRHIEESRINRLQQEWSFPPLSVGPATEVAHQQE